MFFEGRDRFKLRWQTTPVADGWVLTVLTIFGNVLDEFWIDEEEVDDLVKLLQERNK